MNYSFTELEPMYEMEKTGEFNPEKPRAKGTAFIAAELSRAGAMLAALWYTAWLESASNPEPVRPSAAFPQSRRAVRESVLSDPGVFHP